MNYDLQYIEFDTFSPLSILTEFENDETMENNTPPSNFEFFFESSSSGEEEFQRSSSNDNSSADEGEDYTVLKKESKPKKKYNKTKNINKAIKKQKLESNITKRPKLTNANHQCQGINRKKKQSMSQCRFDDGRWRNHWSTSTILRGTH